MFAWCWVVLSGDPPLNNSGEPIGGDYIAFYAAGRLLLAGDGAHLYDHAAVSALQETVLDGRIDGFYDAFRNPPFFALPFVPLALLPLLPSFAVWSLISFACLAAAIWLVLDDLPFLKPRWRGLATIVFAFGPVYFGIINGQNATVSLLLYVLIYRALIRGQDHAAGIWAALGVFKPQLFFVFPLLFLAARRWRALATYLATLAALAVISVLVVGVDGMAGWLRILVEQETGNATRNAWRMHSLKAFADLLLPGQTALALIVYATATIGLLALLWRMWSARAEVTPRLWTFTALAAALINPHLVDYDLTVLVPAGVLAAMHIPSVRWWIVLLYPLLIFRAQLPLGGSAIQLSTVALICLAAVVWRVRAPAAWVPGALREAPSAVSAGLAR